MANYQITNRTGAQVKAVLDTFTSAAAPYVLTLQSTYCGTKLIGGVGSIKAGNNSTLNASIGIGSLAIGDNIIASGDYSHAGGYGSEASGAYSIAMGHNTIASAEDSVAIGRGATASGA